MNRLPLDRYLRGVVPWEMPDDWHPQALRAQAVVARSYALATLKPGRLFDLYADTRSQVYGGVPAEAVTTNRAIGATAGKVLYWKGRVATTFYHSTSGGRTVSIAEAWPKAVPVPYLVSVADPYDTLSKHHRWGPFLLTRAQLAQRLGLPRLRDLVVTRGPSGRAVSVQLKGVRSTRTMLSQDFRRALDLRSTWFAVRVLNLDTPLERALANRPLKLTGFVRGLRKVRLEQQVERRRVDDGSPREDAPGRALHGHRDASPDDELPARDAQGRRRSGHRQAALAPVGRSALEKGAEALLAFVARAPLGDPPRGLRPVRPLEHEPLGVTCGSRACALAARRTIRSTAASRSASTSCTRPIRCAVAASKRSPVTK